MDTQAVCQLIRLNFGLDVTGLERADGGMDSEAQCFVATTGRGFPYFLKLRTRPSPGLMLSSALVDRGIDNVVGPLETLSGAKWVEEGNSTLVIYPFVKGKNGWSDELEPRHWTSLGKTLKAVHSSPLAELPVEGLAIEQFEVEGTYHFLDNWKRLQNARSMNVQEAGLLAALNGSEEKIMHVFERCEHLGQLCRASDWTPVVCHADIHVGNVIKTEEGTCVIVDWDDPRLAPRECDLMFFLDGGIADHEHWTERSFFEGYGDDRVDPTLMAYYKYARAAEDIVSFGCDALEEDPIKAAEALKWLADLFRPGMIVESAQRWEKSRCSFGLETLPENLHD